MAIFSEKNKLKYLIGFLNSKLSQLYLHIFNEGLNYNQGDIAKLPIIYPQNEKLQEINDIVDKCIAIEKEDWDAFETSWDFKKHPLLKNTILIRDAYEQWDRECNERINQLKELEEKLNRHLIEIYDLEDEVSPDIDESELTLHKADLEREIKGLISYAVGCMFGRYSLDKEGIIYAGGEWTMMTYNKFLPDNDNIIPICDDEYFNDDVVNRFIEFVSITFGKDTLEENLSYIASVLKGTGSSREVLRYYFMNSFYNDHLKMYQKRPIYWMFDSEKKQDSGH